MSQLNVLKAIGRHPEIIEPFGNYMTVRLLKPEETTVGGILLPEASRDKQVLAQVIDVGQGQRNINTGEYMGCLSQPGDLVIVLKHAPVEMKLAGETFHVVFEGDVIGRVNAEKLEALLAELEAEAEKEADEAAPVKVEPTEQISAGGIVIAKADAI